MFTAVMAALARGFADVRYEEYGFDGAPYLGFPASHDVYGDGSIPNTNLCDWIADNVAAGAGHSFTNPGADKLGMDGVRYDAKTDRRSHAHLRVFLDEVFAKK